MTQIMEDFLENQVLDFLEEHKLGGLSLLKNRILNPEHDKQEVENFNKSMMEAFKNFGK